MKPIKGFIYKTEAGYQIKFKVYNHETMMTAPYKSRISAMLEAERKIKEYFADFSMRVN